MNIKRTLQLLTITGALCLTTSQLHGQVTIGAGLEPVKGALLDLKEKDSNGDVTATKGLNLPRVNLTVLTKLTGGPSGSPVITDVTDAEPDKSTHIGLTVYNVGYCPGVYVWTGTEWIKLGEPCAPVSPPSAPVNGSFCGPSGTANLSVTAGTDETADWYANATGGSPLPNGTGTTTFTTPTISSTTIYYAETRNTITGAKSATRTPVTATLVAPATLIWDTGKGNASQTIIAGNSITPIVYTYGGGATGVITDLPPANYTIDATANTITIYGHIAATTIYTVTAMAISPCSDVQMSGVLDHLPAPPRSFADVDFCGPSGTANLSVTVGPGETADWYANATGGSPLANGTGKTTFTTPTINATTTYYAEARNTTTNITSPTRTAVTARIKSAADFRVSISTSSEVVVYTTGQDNDISNDKFVANTIPTLSVTGTGTGLTYKWQSKKLEDAGYRDINGATSASYTPGSPGTGQAAYNYLGLYQYRCIVRDASGCEATTANIEVAWGCGAKTTSGAWLKFMCHNLGADENLDPFTWKSNGDNVGNDIKGDLYQWGRRKDGHQLRASGTTSTLATTNTPNHAFYITSTSTPYDWRSGGENVTRWGDGTQNSIMPKAANDPCPAGWKVPSMGQWNSVSGIYSGTEIRDNASRFQNGYTIAPSLYLPAAGGRDTRGTLSVDSTGRYWTSTISQPSTINIHNRYDICSYGMTFGHLNPENFSITPYSNMDRSQGRSVRCIAE